MDINKKELFFMSINPHEDSKEGTLAIDKYKDECYNYFPVIDYKDFFITNSRNIDGIKNMKKFINIIATLDIKMMGIRMFDFPKFPDKKNVFHFRLEFYQTKGFSTEDNEHYVIIPITPVYGFDSMDDEEGPKELSKIYASLAVLLVEEFGEAFPDMVLMYPNQEDESFALGFRSNKPIDSNNPGDANDLKELLHTLFRFIKSSKINISYILYESN